MGLDGNVCTRSRAEEANKVEQNPNQAWPSLEMKSTGSEIRDVGSNPGSATY